MALVVLSLAGCADRRGRSRYIAPSDASFEDDLGSPASIRELCERLPNKSVPREVFFPSTPRGCPWGQNGNLSARQGRMTARVEQRVTLEVPPGGIICDLDFEFSGLDPALRQILTYDDNFLLAFDDAVLAASYGPMVDEFVNLDSLFIYDWERIAGLAISFDARVPHYCLGEADRKAECTIPPPETPGPIALQFDSELVDQLSFLAEQQQRYEFLFVSLGDNDPALDCFHEDFRFTVHVAYVDDPR